MDEKPQIIYKMRKSTGKTVAIVILLLLLLSSLGYIGYFEYQKQLDKNNSPKKEVRKELYYSEVDKLVKQIDLYNQIFKSQYPITDVQKIDNQLKLQFGILALQNDENIKNYYKIEDIKEIYHNYFKQGFSAIYENIKCPAGDDVLYQLNNDTKTYILEDGHNHNNISMDTKTYFESGKIEENKYIINTHILYSNYCNKDTCNSNGSYYTSYQDCIDSKNSITSSINEYENIKGSIPTTTFTFVKDRSNFRLESIEIN